MHRVPKGSRGVTLIELMLALVISSIVGATFFTTMIYQQRAYLHRLSNTEAQQNGRAALDILRNYFRQAGWGVRPSPNMSGSIPVGACFASDFPKNESRDCDNVDANEHSNVPGTGELAQDDGVAAGSDRVRLIFALPNGFVEKDAVEDNGSEFKVDVTGPLAGHPIEGLALISGVCGDGATVGTDLIEVGGSIAKYTYALNDPTPPRGCPAVGDRYDDNFSFGRAGIADFFINRSIKQTPRLMVRFEPSGPMEPGGGTHVVAYDIDDLQFEYGIDTGNPVHADRSVPDGAVDLWCDDPRIPLDGGRCDTNYSSRENFARIIAARIAVVTRTRDYERDRDVRRQGPAYTVTPMTVHNHRIVGDGDGFERWVYKSTVALRNNDLR